jgi:hypothetical protein
LDETLYAKFLAARKAGLRDEAKVAISQFVESFAGFAEKEAWTRQFLSTLPPGERVRHELYERVIFPVLLAGHDRLDPWSIYWLGETAQNLYRAWPLYKQLGAPPIQRLFKEAYALAPSSAEIRQGLLRDLLRGFDYMAHEWPSGILYAAGEPLETQHREALQDIQLARSIDDNGAHAQKIDDFEQKVLAYAVRWRRNT